MRRVAPPLASSVSFLPSGLTVFDGVAGPEDAGVVSTGVLVDGNDAGDDAGITLSNGVRGGSLDLFKSKIAFFAACNCSSNSRMCFSFMQKDAF